MRRIRGGQSSQVAEGDSAPMGARAASALGWGIFNAAAGRLGTMAIGIALARILGPEQFGIYAVALLVLMAALSFNELGVSLAIVRWSENPRLIAPTVATVSVGASAIIAVTGAVLAPTLSHALGDDSATPVVQVLFLTVVISGFVATPAALLQRDFRQRTRTAIDQATIWVGAIVSIVLAVAGLGAMSLAIGRLVGVVISCCLFLKVAPEGFRLGWARSRVRPLLGFGLPLAAASIVVFAVSFVDQIVATRVLGTTALAFYVLAGNLANWPMTMFSAPLRSVAPAAFARLQHDPVAMQVTFNRVGGLLAAVTFPVCFVLAAAADPVIRVVYGADYLPAAEPLLWLAIAVAFRLLFELAYDYIVVAGGTRPLMGLQVVWLVTLLPTLVAGSRWGLAGIAGAQVAVAALVIAPLYAVMLRRVGVSLLPLASRLWRPALGSAAAGGLAMWVSGHVREPLLALGLSMFIGLIALSVLVWRDRGVARSLRETSSSPHLAETAQT